MMTTCLECGKRFYVLYPNLYRYKRKDRYLCSYSCMRAYDRKEAEDMENMKKDGTPRKKTGPKPKNGIAQVKVDGALLIETPEAEKIEIVETPEKPKKPVKAYTVTGIRTEEFGEFYFDQKFNSIDWRTIEGDEVSLSPIGWKNLMEEMPDILRALGVE